MIKHTMLFPSMSHTHIEQAQGKLGIANLAHAH